MTDVEIERVAGRHIETREHAVRMTEACPGSQRIVRRMRLGAAAEIDLRGHEVLEFRVEQASVRIQLEHLAERPAKFGLESQRAAPGRVVGQKDERRGVAGNQLERRAHLLVVATAVKRGHVERDGGVEQRRLDARLEIPQALRVEFTAIVRHDAEIETARFVTPRQAHETRQLAGMVVAQGDLAPRHRLGRAGAQSGRIVVVGRAALYPQSHAQPRRRAEIAVQLSE